MLARSSTTYLPVSLNSYTQIRSLVPSLLWLNLCVLHNAYYETLWHPQKPVQWFDYGEHKALCYLLYVVYLSFFNVFIPNMANNKLYMVFAFCAMTQVWTILTFIRVTLVLSIAFTYSYSFLALITKVTGNIFALFTKSLFSSHNCIISLSVSSIICSITNPAFANAFT